MSTFSQRPSGFTDAVCAALKRHGTPGLFESLGQWLARFVHELNEYLPVKVEYVEAAGFSLCHVESMALSQQPHLNGIARSNIMPQFVKLKL